MEFNIVILGDRIRSLRTSRNMTQLQLAMVLGISSKHLSNIETGRKGPSVDLLVLIADYFHISLDYLILGSTNTPYHKPLSPGELTAAQHHLNELKKLLTSQST